MAAKGARQGSAEKVCSIRHTRINDEAQMEEIYEIKGLLGEGSFGVVREVVHRDTKERWACKAINKEKAGSSKIKLLEREVSILKRVHHDHIIRLKEVFETPQKMYLVMELCEGGELSKYLQKHGAMEEEDVKQIMSRLASAISYLHKNDMVHRDLKLENILLSPDPKNSNDKFYIKVTDFGLSVVKGGVGHENMMMDFCGTPLYMAPEILDNKAYGQLCDVWAMGVIMYSLVTGAPPFQHAVDEELFNLIRNADISKVVSGNDSWRKFSEEAKDLIQGMLNKDPAHRLTASEVLHHSWITGKDPKAGPRNVLEMMKEFHSSTVNGEKDGCDNKESEEKSNTQQGSEPSSTPTTTTTDKNTVPQVMSGSKSTMNHKSKNLTRNVTDPNLLQTSKVYPKSGGSKSSTPNRRILSKSKSPTDRDVSNPHGRLIKGQGFHGTKPSATHTSIGGGTSANSMMEANAVRTNLSPSVDQNHKSKKKLSR